jgi:hypothetical protein
MNRNVWFSRRAFRLHAVILVVVPGFMALCVWQITRALGGNSLSWAYVFEWPLFAGYAVYMWWRLVHEDAPAVPAGGDAEKPETLSTAPGANEGSDGNPASLVEEVSDQRGAEPSRQEGEDEELAAYNEYLAQLAAQDEAAGR